jgi:hypothetical protein
MRHLFVRRQLASNSVAQTTTKAYELRTNISIVVQLRMDCIRRPYDLDQNQHSPTSKSTHEVHARHTLTSFLYLSVHTHLRPESQACHHRKSVLRPDRVEHSLVHRVRVFVDLHMRAEAQDLGYDSRRTLSRLANCAGFG